MIDKPPLPRLLPTGNRRSPPLLILGLLLFTAGTLMLADRFGIFKWEHLWGVILPVGLVVFGIVTLFQPGSRPWGLLSIVGGALMFARDQRWIDFNLWNILPPVMLVWVGSIVLWRAFTGNDPLRPQPADQGSVDFVRSHVVMSGADLRPVSRTFSGGDLFAVFGGIKLDLSAADIQGDTAIIDLHAVLGGIELHVPSDWSIRTDTVVVMAGMSDNRRPTSEPPKKTLILRGFALLAGIDIRN